MAAITTALDAARNRNFEPTLYVEYLGEQVPMTGTTAKMEIRQYGGEAGAALVSISDVGLGDEPLGRTEIDPEDGIEKPVRRIVLLPAISKEDLAALPGLNQPEAGDPQRFEFEVMLIYADTKRDSLWIGDFNLYPGVVA